MVLRHFAHFSRRLYNICLFGPQKTGIRGQNFQGEVGLLVSAMFTLIVFLFCSFLMSLSLHWLINSFPSTFSQGKNFSAWERTYMPHNALRLGYPFCLAPGKQVGMLREVDVAGWKGKPAVWCRRTFPVLPGSCSSRDWVMETGLDLLVSGRAGARASCP